MMVFQYMIRSWGILPQAVQGDSSPLCEGDSMSQDGSLNGLGLESPATKWFIPQIVLGILGGGQLLAQDVAETDDIRGPKPLIEIPKPEQPDHTIWIVLAAVLLLAVIGFFLWRYFRRKSIAKTPSEMALSSLSELGSSSGNLPAEEFAERAALSVRRYIAGAFGIAAPNRTTEEFFRALPESSIRDDEGHLHSFLKSCDLAKFAAADLDRDRRAKLIESAERFVKSTSPEGGKKP